jgi:transcriptional regulator with XRE-family HTH domain
MRYWDFEEDFDESVQVGLLIIGGLVRDARLHRNLTQRQLAWASTLTQSTISKLETGRLRGMRLRTLAAIIGVLRMNTARAGSPHRRLPGMAGSDDRESRSMREPASFA